MASEQSSPIAGILPNFNLFPVRNQDHRFGAFAPLDSLHSDVSVQMENTNQAQPRGGWHEDFLHGWLLRSAMRRYVHSGPRCPLRDATRFLSCRMMHGHEKAEPGMETGSAFAMVVTELPRFHPKQTF